jgi:outer membrane protein TolC
MRVTADNVAILESLERLANNKFKSGEASMVDVLRTEMDVAELEDQLAGLRDKQAPYRQALAEAVNQPSDALPLMPDTLRLKRLSASPSNLKDTLEKHNPKLQQLALETRSQSPAEKVAGKQAYPDLKLGVQYINTGERAAEEVPDNGQDAFMPNVSISIPINQQAYQAEQQEAAYRKDAAARQEEAMRNKFMTRLEEAYETYRDAQRRVQLYQEQVSRAQQALDILMTNYSSGDDFEELLRMQQQRLDYELALAQARVDQNQSVARIRYLTGQALNA